MLPISITLYASRSRRQIFRGGRPLFFIFHVPFWVGSSVFAAPCIMKLQIGSERSMSWLIYVRAVIKPKQLQNCHQMSHGSCDKVTRNPPIGWAKQNAAPLKFNPKPSEAAFSTSDSCRPEVDSDVIFGTAVKQVSMDIGVKCDDFISNHAFLPPQFVMDDERRNAKDIRWVS